MRGTWTRPSPPATSLPHGPRPAAWSAVTPAPMDGPACRRSAIESLGESLVDGVVSPFFWYALGGIPGIVLFKIVSTMDSMVGYKTKRYRDFGWCGARLDDLLNLIPARLTWLLLAGAAVLVPGASGREALRWGWRQHAVVPGPNAGWSEAALAGAIRRRLAGPIWLGGRLVTDVWIGDPTAADAGTARDYRRGVRDGSGGGGACRRERCGPAGVRVVVNR